MSTPTIYVPKAKCKRIDMTGANGTWSKVRIGLHAETLIAFVKQHANAAGYINFELKEKREPDQYGNTHSLSLDTWQPKAAGERTATQPAAKAQEPAYDGGSSEVPF